VVARHLFPETADAVAGIALETVAHSFNPFAPHSDQLAGFGKVIDLLI
jgi:hypothetical protein